jgi:hypothetical protein
MLQAWALELLRCIFCNAQNFKQDEQGLRCTTCEKLFPIRSGILDMLGEPHEIVFRELKAVEKLDHSESQEEPKIKGILQKMDATNYEPSVEEQKEFPSLTHLLTTRRQIDELLRRVRLTPNSIVYEIGADHCMISNLLSISFRESPFTKDQNSGRVKSRLSVCTKVCSRQKRNYDFATLR